MGLQDAVIKLATDNPELRRHLVPLLRKYAATRYEVDGELLTKGQMMGKAKSKEVVFMGGDNKPTFHAVMGPTKGGGDSVFKITQSDYEKSKLKDTSSPQQLEKFYKWFLKKKNLSMSDAVDFNMWAKEKKRTVQERIEKLRKMAQFVIGPSGLEKPKRVKLEPNTIHYMGASSSPSVVIVTKADDEWVEFLDAGGSNRRDQAWIAEDLIAKGDATWLKTYASYVTKYEDWKKVQPGSKVNPKKFFRDREKVQVTVEAIAPVNKYPRNDPWYGAEEYGGVGGSEKPDGTPLYIIDTTQGQLDKLKKDKRFKVVKTQKR